MSETHYCRWWDEATYNPSIGVSVETETQHYLGREKPYNITGEEALAAVYVEKLLPLELRHAANQQQPPALNYRPCHTLALLVGFSLDPLLQVVSVLQPTHLVLVLSEKYGKAGSGGDRGRRIRDFIKKHLAGRIQDACQRSPELVHRFPGVPPGAPLELPLSNIEWCVVNDKPRDPATVDTTPGKVYSVFRGLAVKVLDAQRQDKPVIIDITGAKKSMSAEAFVFAAYADIPISYVDFIDYDPQKRQPLGYTCRIGLLDNPYKQFSLRLWQDVARQYADGHYRAAGRKLETILPSVAFPMFDETHEKAVKNLQQLIQFYEAWDDGDYCRASELEGHIRALDPTVSLPTSVGLLEQAWPEHPSDGASDAEIKLFIDDHVKLQEQIFTDNKLLLAYARDELARIERLIDANEDNRSALLRAAALDEFLLKVRVARLWQHGDLSIKLTQFNLKGIYRFRSNTAAKLPGHPWQQLEPCLWKVLSKYRGTDYMRDVLCHVQRGTNKTRPFLQLQFYRNDPPTQFEPEYAEANGSVTIIAKVKVTYDGNAGGPKMKKYWETRNVRLKPGTMKVLRDQAVHTSLSLPKELAEAALAITRANLEEFERNGWTALVSGEAPAIRTDALPWDDALALCGVDFLPRMKDERRGNGILDSGRRS